MVLKLSVMVEGELIAQGGPGAGAAGAYAAAGLGAPAALRFQKPKSMYPSATSLCVAGDRLFSGCDDGQVHMWDVGVDEARRPAPRAGGGGRGLVARMFSFQDVGGKKVEGDGPVYLVCQRTIASSHALLLPTLLSCYLTFS